MWKITHWMTWTKIYFVYRSMTDRCNNKNNRRYKDWGGRWITYEWNSFEEFYKDMWTTYKEWLSLDRVDNNKNYSKQNCRWVDMNRQQRNRNNNRMYKWKCLEEWIEEKWLNRNTVRTRIYRLWWSMEKALEFNK